MSAKTTLQRTAPRPRHTKTLLFAHIQHPPSQSSGPQYCVRKSETGPVSEDGDPEARKQWKPATKTAMKKAGNLYEQHKKKLSKGDELAIRDKAEQKNRQRALQETMKVKIAEDTTLPKATKIRLDETDRERVKLRSGSSEKDMDYSAGRGS